MSERIRLAMLISGGGTTMEKIAEATRQHGELEGKIIPAVVISSRDDAGGIEKARALGIPTEVVKRRDYEKGEAGLEAFGWIIIGVLRKYGAEYVSQNGWLPLTPKNVIYEYEDRIFNQHPGPLDPGHVGEDGMPIHFGGKGMHGLAVHAAVLEFQRLSGRVFPTEATIHRVRPNVDGGPVVARREVTVKPDDSPETLAARVLPVEHALQIGFWQSVSDGTVSQLARPQNLIMPGEEALLRRAIVYARETYPNG